MGLRNIISKLKGKKQVEKTDNEKEIEEHIATEKSQMYIDNIIEHERRNFLYGK